MLPTQLDPLRGNDRIRTQGCLVGMFRAIT
jgi:hypothetical protein